MRSNFKENDSAVPIVYKYHLCKIVSWIYDNLNSRINSWIYHKLNSIPIWYAYTLYVNDKLPKLEHIENF